MFDFCALDDANVLDKSFIKGCSEFSLLVDACNFLSKNLHA